MGACLDEVVELQESRYKIAIVRLDVRNPGVCGAGMDLSIFEKHVY